MLSVYCKGVPASKNDQLCMLLNMYICAFVYSIGVHWYFCFSSQGFTKKIKADSVLTCNRASCCSALTMLTNMTRRWLPVWHHRKSPLCLSLSTNQYGLPPPAQPTGTLPLAPQSIQILLQWSLLAVSQLTDDPVLHVELTQRIGTRWKASI